VLATGAHPFVPPVPGRDLENVFVYRTIEDLEAIRKAARRARSGAVIGGGLLGLEAANALRQLGLETHVVELAPRLMAVQVDAAGGRTLSRHIEGLGLSVHTGAMTEAILGPDRAGRATGLALKDRKALDVDIVVFSAGIRPQDALGRAAELAIAERGGILVDEHCRTSDEHIFAIGECAAPGGVMYGLVAPGYAMAEVVVDTLLGGDGTFAGADMSTKLKLLGVDVASFGDAHGTTEGALELTYADDVAGVYKKLVIAEDPADGTRRLLGGVLVGDASAYGVLRPMAASGLPLPDNPEDLILPAGGGGGAALALPAEAQVCSCNNVTRAAIEAAVDAGCETATDVTRETKAGATCGSCKSQVKKIVEDHFAAQGRTVDRSLCEHFPLTRAELFDVVLIHGHRTFDQIIEAHGTGRGCDVCRPTVASILASQLNGHVLAPENRTLQDTNDAYLANIQRNGTYSVVPRIPGGEITPERLIVIGEVARDFGLYTKITGGQRIDLLGARMEQLPAIWTRLVDAGFESGHAYGKALRTVKSCVGSTWCRYGVQDSVRRPRHPAGAALPRPEVTAQAQGRRLRLCPRVRRGARQGLRRDRHREGLEPVRRRQRRRRPGSRPAAGRRPVDRGPRPLPGPVPHVLHPHRRPAAAHLDLDRPARRWPRPRPRGRRRRRPRPRHRAGGGDGPARRRLRRRVAGHPRGPGQARPVRLLRQRARPAGPDDQLRHHPGPDRPGTRPGRPRRRDPGRSEPVTPVCPLDRIDRESGVTALVDGHAVAVFRTYDDQVFALSNFDPFGRAGVLARGIVGTRGDVPFVASPLHKQAFDLRTGQCLDDPRVSVASYEVDVRDGMVRVGAARR